MVSQIFYCVLGLLLQLYFFFNACVKMSQAFIMYIILTAIVDKFRVTKGMANDLMRIISVEIYFFPLFFFYILFLQQQALKYKAVNPHLGNWAHASVVSVCLSLIQTVGYDFHSTINCSKCECCLVHKRLAYQLPIRRKGGLERVERGQQNWKFRQILIAKTSSTALEQYKLQSNSSF